MLFPGAVSCSSGLRPREPGWFVAAARRPSSPRANADPWADIRQGFLRPDRGADTYPKLVRRRQRLAYRKRAWQPGSRHSLENLLIHMRKLAFAAEPADGGLERQCWPAVRLPGKPYLPRNTKGAPLSNLRSTRNHSFAKTALDTLRNISSSLYEVSDVTLESHFIVIDGLRRCNGRVHGPRLRVAGR